MKGRDLEEITGLMEGPLSESLEHVHERSGKTLLRDGGSSQERGIIRDSRFLLSQWERTRTQRPGEQLCLDWRAGRGQDRGACNWPLS